MNGWMNKWMNELEFWPVSLYFLFLSFVLAYFPEEHQSQLRPLIQKEVFFWEFKYTRWWTWGTNGHMNLTSFDSNTKWQLRNASHSGLLIDPACPFLNLQEQISMNLLLPLVLWFPLLEMFFLQICTGLLQVFCQCHLLKVSPDLTQYCLSPFPVKVFQVDMSCFHLKY